MSDPNPVTMCPSCAGEKRSYRITHHTNRAASYGWAPCETCAGVGSISLERSNVLTEAERHRQDRVDRGVSLRAEAARLGISSRELSDREHGRAPWEVGP